MRVIDTVETCLHGHVSAQRDVGGEMRTRAEGRRRPFRASLPPEAQGWSSLRCSCARPFAGAAGMGGRACFHQPLKSSRDATTAYTTPEGGDCRQTVLSMKSIDQARATFKLVYKPTRTRRKQHTRQDGGELVRAGGQGWQCLRGTEGRFRRFVTAPCKFEASGCVARRHAQARKRKELSRQASVLVSAPNCLTRLHADRSDTQRIELASLAVIFCLTSATAAYLS